MTAGGPAAHPDGLGAGRVRSAAAAHPHLVTAGWAAFWAAPLLGQAATEAGAPAVLAALVVASPLLARHRRPLAVLAAVTVLAGVAWVLVDDGVAFPAVLVLLAVYSAATRVRGTRLAWSVGAVAVALAALAPLAGLERPGPAGQASPFALGSLLLAATLLGVNTRVRREHVAWLEERAHRLEAERDQRARMAVAAERAAIARELHDVVAHSLTVIVRLADGMAAQAARSPGAEPSAEALAAVGGTGRQALTEMRRLLDVLREDDDRAGGAGRAPQPGPEQLDELVSRVRAAGLPVRLTRTGDASGWSAGSTLAVHRIVQEALTNVLDHAGPGARAEVALRTDGDRVEVEVVDDGRGGRGGRAPQTAAGRGRGLVGARERAASFGGRLEAGPRPGGGWRVRAQLDVDSVAPVDGIDGVAGARPVAAVPEPAP